MIEKEYVLTFVGYKMVNSLLDWNVGVFYRLRTSNTAISKAAFPLCLEDMLVKPVKYAGRLCFTVDRYGCRF